MTQGAARPSPVKPIWSGLSVAVVASGPSATIDDGLALIDLVDRVIAVNDAHQVAPQADLIYACDGDWWLHHGEAVRAAYSVPLWTQDKGPDAEDAAARFGLRVVESRDEELPSLDRQWIAQGRNSGFQAVNLAVHLGASRVALLGFDMGNAADGRTHFFGDHPGRLNRQNDFAAFREAFDRAAPVYAAAGVDIVNLSRTTALTCFRRADLGGDLWACTG